MVPIIYSLLQNREMLCIEHQCIMQYVYVLYQADLRKGDLSKIIGHNINMPLDWSQCEAVESVPGKVSGAWVFRGTRMPVSVVFENLQDGMTIDELIETYDGLTREHIQAALAFAAQSLQVPEPAHAR